MTATGAPAQIDAYTKWSFSAPISGRQATFQVYSRGEGPPVVIIQELPGIGQETLGLADRLVAAGFHVYLPHLFGPIGRVSMLGNTIRVLCMRREFQIFEAGRSSAVTDWLRALCGRIKQDTGAKGVGTIGMCLTGNFAISLMADEAVIAGVASQPSMPINKHGALHMSADEIAGAKAKLDRTGPMLALRFEGDPLCTAEKFKAIDAAFNGDRERVALRVLPGKGHSVLTMHFVDEAGHPTRAALDEVTAYFRAALA